MLEATARQTPLPSSDTRSRRMRMRVANRVAVHIVPAPYPAALTIPHTSWRCALACDGHIPLAPPVIHIGPIDATNLVPHAHLVSPHHPVIRWPPTPYHLH